MRQHTRVTGGTVISIMSSSVDELIRKPEQQPRVTLLELFFDLVFVFAFTRVTDRLVKDITDHQRTFLLEIGETLQVLLALLVVWFVTAWVTNLYDQQRPEIQLVIAGTIFGALGMAITLPQAFSKHGLTFASEYVAIHIGRGLILVPALRGHEAQRRAAGVLLWFGASAIPWIVGAILPVSPSRVALWTLAVVIDLTGAMLLWPAPWTSMRRPWPVSSEYLSERYRQFFVIALGELILIGGITLEFRGAGGAG